MRTLSLLIAATVAFTVWNCSNGDAGDSPSPFYFPPPVGELGDMQKLEVEGELTVAPAAIRHALDGSLAVTQVSRPSMQLSALLTTIDNELLRGYAASGFPDAVVSTRHDPNRNVLVTSIEEGSQFKCRDIIVEGVDGDIAQMVRKALRPGTPAPVQVKPPAGVNIEVATPTKDQNQARWTTGKTCYFGPDQAKRFEPNVTSALEEAGLVAPVFVINLVRNDDQHVVDLHVTVSETNDLQLISEIKITGLEMNSEADVRALINIAPGTSWMPSTKAGIEKALLDSGRFVKWDIKATSDVPDSKSVCLMLKLQENIFVPPLCDELGDVAQVMLRSCVWMNDWQAGGPDFSVQLWAEKGKGFLAKILPVEAAPERFAEQPVDLRFVVSPSGNVFALVEAGVAESGTHMGYAVSLNQGQFRLDSLHARQSLVMLPDDRTQTRFHLNFYAPDDQDKGRRYGLTFNFGVGNGDGPYMSAIPGLHVQPGFQLNSAYDPTRTYEFTENSLIVHEPKETKSVLDIDSGQWLHGGGEFDDADNSGRLEYRFESGLLQQDRKSVV